jgi:hypothetical protein
VTGELSTQAPAGPPALAYNPSQELTSEDIPTPRIKFGQGLSHAVMDGTVQYGAIYSVVGQDDPAPSTLVPPSKENGQTGDELRFYVLSGPRKAFSWTNPSNDLDNNRDGSYPDLSQVKDGDPRKVYRTFDYTRWRSPPPGSSCRTS